MWSRSIDALQAGLGFLPSQPAPLSPGPVTADERSLEEEIQDYLDSPNTPLATPEECMADCHSAGPLDPDRVDGTEQLTAVTEGVIGSTGIGGVALGVRDLVMDPSMATLSAAAVGVVPGVRAGKALGNVADAAKDAADLTKDAARRKVMEKQGIPTSQQPISQSRNASGREYQYEVPKPGGGTEIKSVQQQTLDRSHPEQAHWEAGTVKTDPLTGEIRTNDYGRSKLYNDKSKVDYDD